MKHYLLKNYPLGILQKKHFSNDKIDYVNDHKIFSRKTNMEEKPINDS